MPVLAFSCPGSSLRQADVFVADGNLPWPREGLPPKIVPATEADRKANTRVLGDGRIRLRYRRRPNHVVSRAYIRSIIRGRRKTRLVVVLPSY